jgi:hypothetical protein
MGNEQEWQGDRTRKRSDVSGWAWDIRSRDADAWKHANNSSPAFGVSEAVFRGGGYKLAYRCVEAAAARVSVDGGGNDQGEGGGAAVSCYHLNG